MAHVNTDKRGHDTANDRVCCMHLQLPPNITYRRAQPKPLRGYLSVKRAKEGQIFDESAIKDSPLPPWLFGFQCNERYLKWDSAAQIQLLKIHAASELGKVLRTSVS